MHELSICYSLMQQVESIAAREHAQRVTLIRLLIGPLAGVEPELLAQAFPVAAAGSCAAEAKLQLDTQPVRVLCESCGAQSDAKPNRLLCGACGDYRTRLISGDEMLLASLELEKSDDKASEAEPQT